MFRKWAYKIFYITFCNIFIFGCISSAGPNNIVHENPAEDENYDKNYEKSTSHAELVKNFETHFIIYATRLNTSFRSSLAKRYLKLFNEPQPILAELSAKSGFFVSVYTRNRDKRNLADQHIWNIQLSKGGEKVNPTTIRYLKDKSRWQPFFKDISPWSREYLVIFDIDTGTKDEKLAVDGASQLLFSNSDGRAIFNW